MKLIKKSWYYLRASFFYLANYFVFRVRNVVIGKEFQVKGIIKIRNKGRVSIGSNFRANSGKNYNPIGGDTVLRFITKKNAEILVGDNSGISNSTFVAKEKIKIGNNVLIGGGCKFWDNDFHSINAEIRVSGNDNNIKSSPIIVCDYAFVGAGSIILKGVTIGKKSIVAAGSVVTKSIPENEIWGGNPAKFIRKNQ